MLRLLYYNISKISWIYHSSSFWFNQNFSVNAPTPVNVIEDMKLYKELGVSHKICTSLAAEGIFIPTLVQHEALPITIGRMQNCIIQSPTGSGKSLTFLIPVLQDKTVGLNSLIIVPSRELALQLEHQSRTLVSGGKLSKNVASLYSGGTSALENLDFVRLNILISTPKTLLEALDSNPSLFKFVNKVILDEVDKLLPSNNKQSSKRHLHVKPTSKILEKLISRNKIQPRLIATSATVTKEIVEKLVDCGYGRDFHFVSTSTENHMTTPKIISHEYMMHSGKDFPAVDKLDVLARYIKLNAGTSTMVVIQRNAPITKFVLELKQKNVHAVPLHEHAISTPAFEKFIKSFQSGQYCNTVVGGCIIFIMFRYN